MKGECGRMGEKQTNKQTNKQTKGEKESSRRKWHSIPKVSSSNPESHYPERLFAVFFSPTR
jgi:hypothetical protein